MNKQIKNFSLVDKTIEFKTDELVIITSTGHKLEILGTSLRLKIDQVFKREGFIMNNIRRIADLTRLESINENKTKISENIQNLKDTNKRLVMEIAKYRAAAILENQGIIRSLDSFTDFMKRYENDEIKTEANHYVYYEVMNEILSNDNKFFARFVGAVLAQSEKESVINFIKPILKEHGYNLSKIPTRSVAVV